MNPLAHPDQRVGIFIDTQNIYHTAKNKFGRLIDFGKLVEVLTGPRKLIKALAYVVKTDFTAKELSFFEALWHRGIQVSIKEMIVYPDGTKKADWDVGIAVDMIKFSPLLDVLILVSGDGDFLPLIEFLTNQGKQIEVAGFQFNTSVKLKEKADYFYNLEEMEKLIFIKSQKRRK